MIHVRSLSHNQEILSQQERTIEGLRATSNPMYMTTEHPQAVQDILNKLDELIDALKQQPPPAVQDSRKRERNPRS